MSTAFAINSVLHCQCLQLRKQQCRSMAALHVKVVFCVRLVYHIDGVGLYAELQFCDKSPN